MNGAAVGEAHGIYFQYVQTRTSPMGGAQGAYRRDGFPGYECLTTQAFTSLKVPVEVFQPLRQLPNLQAGDKSILLVAFGTISNPIGNTDPKCVPCSRKVHPKTGFGNPGIHKKFLVYFVSRFGCTLARIADDSGISAD